MLDKSKVPPLYVLYEKLLFGPRTSNNSMNLTQFLSSFPCGKKKRRRWMGKRKRARRIGTSTVESTEKQFSLEAERAGKKITQG